MSLHDTTKLRFWCQKILPLVYDESLSYYELLNKVVEKLNLIIENDSEQNDEIERLGGLIGGFDERITTNTENIATNTEDIATNAENISNLDERYTEMSERITEEVARLEEMFTEPDSFATGGTTNYVLAIDSNNELVWRNVDYLQSAVPAGGSEGQVLTKNGNSDFDTSWQTLRSVPVGGVKNQALVKNSNQNYDITWGGTTVPSGGTYGQVLGKASGSDYDVQWLDVTEEGTVPTARLLPEGGTTGQALIKTSDDNYAVEWGVAGLLPQIIVDAESGSTVTVRTAELNVFETGTEVEGKWVFKVKDYGNYIVEATKGIYSNSEIVNVDTVKQYPVDLEFFRATINVTFPANSTCTCSNGITTLTATTSPAVFVVNNSGTWNVRAYNSSQQSANQDVTITTSGQTENVTLTYFGATINVTYPAGATCTATDGTLMLTATTNPMSFLIPRAGTWIITASDGIQISTNTTVVTTSGQTFNVTLAFYDAHITVNFPANSTCTVSDGTTTQSATTSPYTFTIPNAGTWTVSATDGTYITTTNVVISNAGQSETVTLTYFQSFINVTFPVNSTCVCSKGGISYTSLVSPHTFTVPESGVWSITATDGINTASTTATISTSGQTVSVTLDFKPIAKTTPTSGVTYVTNLNNLTANKIKLYSEAISNNSQITNTTTDVYIDDGNDYYKLSVGSQVDNVYLIAGMTSCSFRIIGFNHDQLANASYYGSTTVTGKAGITWESTTMTPSRWNMFPVQSPSAPNGWANSNMRVSTMPQMIANFTYADIVAPVIKTATTGIGTYAVENVQDNMFILSEYELKGTSVYNVVDGTRYKYYIDGGAINKPVFGSETIMRFWTRTASQLSNTYREIDASGNMVNIAPNTTMNIAVAFCS